MMRRKRWKYKALKATETKNKETLWVHEKYKVIRSLVAQTNRHGVRLKTFGTH